MRLIDADALKPSLRKLLDHYGCRPNDFATGKCTGLVDAMDMIDAAPTIDAIPVEYLMKYAQLPTEFAIATWQKQDKDAQKKRIKRLDKPISLDDALNLVNDVFPFGKNEQEAKQ